MASLFERYKRAWVQIATFGIKSKKGEEIIEHHKEAYAKDHTLYNAMGGALSGVVIGPVGPAAFGAVEAANQYRDMKDSADAAAAQYAQNPVSFEEDTQVGGFFSIGAGRGMGAWIPVVLIFVVIMYLIFKD